MLLYSTHLRVNLHFTMVVSDAGGKVWLLYITAGCSMMESCHPGLSQSEAAAAE